MQKNVTKIEQTVKLPQTIYNNIHGVELVERNTFCSNCAALHQDHMLRFPYMDLVIYLEEEEYKSFEESGIIGYTIESFYDLYQDGYCLYREDLRFIILDGESHDAVALVARLDEDRVFEIHYDQERFKSIQDILAYTGEDFENDFNSGSYETDMTER